MKKLLPLRGLKLKSGNLMVDFMNSSESVELNTQLPLALDNDLNIREFTFRPSFYCSSNKFRQLYEILSNAGLKLVHHSDADIAFTTHKQRDPGSQYTCRLQGQGLLTDPQKFAKLLQKSFLDTENQPQPQQSNEETNFKAQDQHFDPFAFNVAQQEDHGSTHDDQHLDWGDFTDFQNEDKVQGDQETGVEIVQQIEGGKDEKSDNSPQKVQLCDQKANQGKSVQVKLKLLIIDSRAIRCLVAADEIDQVAEKINTFIGDLMSKEAIKNCLFREITKILVAFKHTQPQSFRKSKDIKQSHFENPNEIQQNCSSTATDGVNDQKRVKPSLDFADSQNLPNQRDLQIAKIKRTIQREKTCFQAFECTAAVKAADNHSPNSQAEDQLEICFESFRPLFVPQKQNQEDVDFMRRSLQALSLQIVRSPVLKVSTEGSTRQAYNCQANEGTDQLKFRSFYRAELLKMIQNSPQYRLSLTELQKRCSDADFRSLQSFFDQREAANACGLVEVPQCVDRGALKTLPYEQLLYLALGNSPGHK